MPRPSRWKLFLGAELTPISEPPTATAERQEQSPPMSPATPAPLTGETIELLIDGELLVLEVLGPWKG